jgi:hypothetical protein
MQLSKPSLLQQQVHDGKPPERIAFGNHHTVHRLSVWRKGQLDCKLWGSDVSGNRNDVLGNPSTTQGVRCRNPVFLRVFSSYFADK